MESKKILIVEDHTAIRGMLVAMFESSGYQVIHADNGATGLQLAQSGGFAAILLDLKMPQLDGLGFLKAIKATPPVIPNGPIIIFSSMAYDYTREEALRAGAAAFIEKDNLEHMALVRQVESIIATCNQPKKTV